MPLVHAYRGLLALQEPPPPCSHSSYGFVLLRHGNALEAQQEFQRDLASCPAARVGIGRLLVESGEREKGLTMLAELAKQDQRAFSAALPRFWEGLDAQQLEALLANLRQSADAIARVVVDGGPEKASVPLPCSSRKTRFPISPGLCGTIWNAARAVRFSRATFVRRLWSATVSGRSIPTIRRVGTGRCGPTGS